jgi:hypothetical protein
MRQRGITALVVCAAAVAPYLPALDDYFVQDDFGVVWLLAQKPASAFAGWFVSTWMDDIWGYTPDEIRPFPAVTYQVAAWWGAASPVANHVINVAFHAGNTLLVLALARRVAGLGAWPAALAALVFAWLPIHPETVAWVTGRVDSMPALFYLASFLAYAGWRDRPSAGRYAASLALFFVALFSKQNTVTLLPALVLFDAIVRAVRPRASWAWVRPYVPFAALTLGYLALRYALFGEVARESLLASQRTDALLQLASRHLSRIVAGEVVPAGVLAGGLAAAGVLAGAALAVSGADRRRLCRAAVYFAAVWVPLGIAPTLVAGYESPRHVYLASSGWAVVVGIAAQALWHARPPLLMRTVVAGVAAVALGVYAARLAVEIRAWGVRAAISRQAVADLEREAAQAPRGALIIAGAPARSWEWSLPFAARPPYASSDLTSRTHIIWPMLLDCCRGQWHDRARATLESWARSPGPPPVVVLHWDAATGRRARVSDADDPFLRSLMRALADTGGPQALQGGLDGALAIASRAAARP